MASIKERAAALNLDEKLRTRPQVRGFVVKGAQSPSLGSSLISHLRSALKVRRLRVYLKSHNDCFLGSEAVDVVAEYISSDKAFEGATACRDKVVNVCQSLLDCNVFEAVGTKVFGKNKKQTEFQDSKSALYRFVHEHIPSVEDLEKDVLVNSIQKLFSCSPSEREAEQMYPSGPKCLMPTPVKFSQTSTKVPQLDSPVSASLPLETRVENLSLSPNRVQTHSVLPQSGNKCLSQSGTAHCKLLLYGTLVRHYNTDRPPLLPERMTDVYSAITELLVDAKLGIALEALQLCLKLLPPSTREELCRILTFMTVAADVQEIKLDKEMENKLAVKRSFSRAILNSKALPKEREDLMVVFMLSNIKEIFKIPGGLHKGVSDKLTGLVQGKQPDVTGCQVSSRTYIDTTKTTTDQELWSLLHIIHLDTKISPKERKHRFRQFYQAHPEIFNNYFGESAVNML
ncbi:DEP domain-containing protein 7-like isoform X2 [Phyllopteryx taeniolatus]|uniref:DEP domain-containing protein 7-like isoform X2 n=1 Tax=Phyllopteryx taeniolatus TaxID=161469 RepID=UPI002AD390CA|nr:DEP domain-containing protein 7-like isoform X2 [Phyllopteryx taeniolatus]